MLKTHRNYEANELNPAEEQQMNGFEQPPMVDQTWWQIAILWATDNPLTWAIALAAALGVVLVILAIRYYRSWPATQERERRRRARENRLENDRLAAAYQAAQRQTVSLPQPANDWGSESEVAIPAGFVIDPNNK